MGILDGIVGWIAEQIMHGLDLISTSVLGALGCTMDTFLRYFPAAETLYIVFVALGIGLVLLNWIWQLFRNYGLGAGLEAEDPFKLTLRSVLFIVLIYFCDEIIDTVLQIGGTPYRWILTSDLPPIQFADFNSCLLVILGVIANGGVAVIALIVLLILAWNCCWKPQSGTFCLAFWYLPHQWLLPQVPRNPHPISFAAGAECSAASFFFC